MNNYRANTTGVQEADPRSQKVPAHICPRGHHFLGSCVQCAFTVFFLFCFVFNFLMFILPPKT